MPLANEGTSVVACVIDVQDRHYVWADVEADRATATVENANSRTVEVMKALVFNTKMTVHDLLILHAQQRGTIATDPNSADLALRWEGFVTDYAKVAGYMDL